jgi:hypothetical protein
MGVSFLKLAQQSSGKAAPAADKKGAPWDAAPQAGKLAASAAAPQVPLGFFFRTGPAARKMFQDEEAKAELRRQEAGRMLRFWMNVGDERRITFLDGALDGDGMLAVPMWYEHRVKLGGNWQNFVCVAGTETCPICETDDNRASLVGIMTVIDHTPHIVQKGPNKGSTVKDTRKLFVPKKETMKVLAKLAAKRGGLTGCTFDVSRTGAKDPSCGNQFDFSEKLTLDEIRAKYGLKPEDVQPADYTKEVVYRPAKELVLLGAGRLLPGVGHEKGVDPAGLAEEL